MFAALRAVPTFVPAFKYDSPLYFNSISKLTVMGVDGIIIIIIIGIF